MSAFKPSEEEERYFQQKERHERDLLRAELAKKADAAAKVSALASTLKLTDQQLAERIFALGFDAESASVLFVLPLIQVAWASGDVSRAERAQVLKVLELRKVARGSKAWLLTETLLEERPSESFLIETRALLKAIVQQHAQQTPGTEGPGEARELIDICMAVADASGGELGIGNRVSKEEEAAIRSIAEAFGDEAVKEFQKLLHEPSPPAVRRLD